MFLKLWHRPPRHTEKVNDRPGGPGNNEEGERDGEIQEGRSETRGQEEAREEARQGLIRAAEGTQGPGGNPAPFK